MSDLQKVQRICSAETHIRMVSDSREKYGAEETKEDRKSIRSDKVDEDAKETNITKWRKVIEKIGIGFGKHV